MNDRHSIFYVLGASGFIGGHVCDCICSNGFKVVELSRPQYDLLNPDSYADLGFNGNVIVDCATLTNGTEDEIRSTVFEGPKALIRSLEGRGVEYLYFSTSATVDDEVAASNPYVRYKRKMEKVILDMPFGKIVRLSFPFGRGENSIRLISRLIRQAMVGKKLSIGDVSLPLTPIEFLNDHFFSLLESDRRVINFTDGATYTLEQIAEVVFCGLSMPPLYTMDLGNRANYSIKSPDVFKNKFDTLGCVRVMAESMLAEYNKKAP